MRKEERQKAILDLLSPTDPIQNKTLIEHFRVADMTIRRDLNELAAQGKLIRTHGGAILVGADAQRSTEGAFSAGADPRFDAAVDAPSAGQYTGGNRNLEPAYKYRAGEHSSQKAAIAHACIALTENKNYVYLDSGSTTFSIAQFVTPEQRCIFLTNGVNVAAELLRQEYPSVISIGGEIDLNTWSTRGTFAERQIRAFHADIAILGCNAISPEGGVMIGNMTETGLKHAIMEISNEIYLVTDSSKFDSYSLTTYAAVRDFDGIITDSLLPAETKRRLEALGARIIIAE